MSLTETEAKHDLNTIIKKSGLDNQQCYLIAKLYEGENLASAARAIGLNPSTARSVVHRARKKMKKLATLFTT
jgi:DNA-directed RNA polymerase specialized sigma24 family protein